jgi:hypothetical protein
MVAFAMGELMALCETGGKKDVAKDFRHPLQAELETLKQS